MLKYLGVKCHVHNLFSNCSREQNVYTYIPAYIYKSKDMENLLKASNRWNRWQRVCNWWLHHSFFPLFCGVGILRRAGGKNFSGIWPLFPIRLSPGPLWSPPSCIHPHPTIAKWILLKYNADPVPPLLRPSSECHPLSKAKALVVANGPCTICPPFPSHRFPLCPRSPLSLSAHCLSNIPGTLSPQGLCMCRTCGLECSSPDTCTACSLFSFSYFQWGLSDHPM